MARRQGLSPRGAPALGLALLLVGLVLLAHWGALSWLGTLAIGPGVLRPMAPPMFTRQIQPVAPTPVAVRAPAPPRKTRPTFAAAPVMEAGRAAPTPSAPELTPTLASTPVADTPTATPPLAALAASAPVAALTQPTQTIAAAATSTAPPGTGTGATASLDSWPVDTRLNYKLTGYYRGPLSGDAHVQWQREGARYQVRIDLGIGFLANVSMTSQGDVTPQGLLPRAYEERRNGKPRTALLGERTITLDGGDAVPRPDGVQDTASQFVELSHRFSSGTAALEAGQSETLWLARPGGVDLWTYDIAEQVTLQLRRLGAVQAFHLKPRPLANPRGNITAEMWFAPALQYLPVRIRIGFGDDTWLDLVVEAIEQR